ncbi:MAG: hypothetical protein JOZ54_07285 [Acidobacteria bacterium]|nr:hypothetical protein [Acidobacteriota bacterium]
MQRNVIVLTLAILTLGTASRPAAQLPDVDRFEISVEVLPTSQAEFQLLRRETPETYTCRASVGPAGEKKAFFAPKLVLLPGEHRSATQNAGPYSATFSVSINKPTDRADVSVDVTKNGVLVARQRSTLWLANPSR